MSQQKKYTGVSVSSKNRPGVKNSKTKKNTINKKTARKHASRSLSSKKVSAKKENTKQRSSSSPAAVLTFFVSCLWIIDLISRLLLGRILGDEGLGSFGLACAVFDFGILLTMEAIPELIKDMISIRFNRREFRNVKAIYHYTMLASALICGIISAVLFVGAPIIVRFLFGNITDMILPLRLTAPAFFISAICGVMSGFSQGLGNAMPSIISHTAEHIVRALASVAAAFLMIGRGFTYGAAGGIIGLLTGTIVCLIILLSICRAYIPWLDKRILKDPNDKLLSGSEIVRYFSISLFPVFIAIAIYEANHLIDGILFTDILSAIGYQTKLITVLFGVYSGKYRLLIELLPILILSCITGLIPEIKILIKTNNLEEMQKRIDEIFRIMFALTLPAAAIVIILAGPFAQLFWGSNSALTSRMFVTGAMIVVLMPMAAFTAEIIRMSHQKTLAIRNAGIAFVIYFIFEIVLLAYADLNVFAMIYANVVFYFAQSALNIHTLKKITDYDFMVVHLAGKSLIFSVIAGAICFLTYRSLYIASGNCISALPAAAVFFAIYCILMIIFRTLTEEEVFMLPFGNVIAVILYRLRIL